MNRQISNQRKFIFIFSLVAIFSVFLPWFNIAIFSIPQTVNGFETSIGKFLFILFIFCAVIPSFGNTSKNIHLVSKIIIIFCTIISLLFLLFLMLGSSSASYPSDIDYGFYISLFSTISILVSTVIFRSTTTKSAITYTQVPTPPETIIISDNSTSSGLNTDKDTQ